MTVPFDAAVEHYPMSGLDEFLIHNHPHPVRVMWTSDVQAYERMWFTSQDTTGDLLVVAGMGIYPNLGTAEAFAIVNLRGRHTTVRAHRKLGLNRMDMTVGPLPFEVVEPFREWRLRLDENDFGIAFDLSWYDTKRPVYRLIGGGMFVGTKPFAGVAGYDGFGRQSGWVTAHGERFELDRRLQRGTRDHHWGTRDGVGGARPVERSPAPPFGRVGGVRGVRGVGGPHPLQPGGSPEGKRHPPRSAPPAPVRTGHPPAPGR